MKQLSFTLSMIDKATRPLKAAQRSINDFAKQSQTAFKQVGIGAVGLWGVAKTLKGALDPAVQLQDALSAVTNKGIDDSALNKLTQSAMQFSSKMGTSSINFINSAGVIKTAIYGLSDQAIPKATIAVNTLALATQSSAEQTAEYMGTMYNQYKTVADRMGKVNFLESVAGQSAYMYKQFGMNMQKMQSLMLSSKGAGSNYGVSMPEQFAVLGQLDKSLGAAAGSGYEQFLKHAASGGKALGVSLVDANGQLLAMPDIIQKLQNKYGKTIQGNVKAQAELDQAFGKGSNVVKALWGNVDSLKTHMEGLGKNQGLDNATKMALKMGNMWQRLTSIWFNIRAAVGVALLPVLEPLVDKVTNLGLKFQRWMQLFPGIAKVIGLVVVAFTAFAAAGAMANIVVGLGQFVMAGYKSELLKLIFTKTLAIIKTVALYAGLLVLGAVLVGLKTLILITKVAMWAFSIATNAAALPVLLIIGAVALLAVGLYFLIKKWDDITAAISNTQAFKNLMMIIKLVGAFFSETWESIKAGWQTILDYFTNTSLIQMFTDLGDAILGIFKSVWNGIKIAFANIYNGIVSKLNYLPGVNIELMEIPTTEPIAAASELLTSTRVDPVKGGGIGQAIANSRSVSTDNSRSVGTVNIYPTQNMSPGELLEWNEMYAG